MEQIIEVLLRRLSHKGVYPNEVPWLIRDVLHASDEGEEITVHTMNVRLANLGWDEEILDEVSFALIRSLAEQRNEGHVEQRIPS